MNWLADKNGLDLSQDEFSRMDNQSEYDSNDTNNLNKYLNIGLSLHSQESICEFHQILNQEDPNRLKHFEDILYSVLDDIQNYRKEARRLEKSYQNEKDKNEETIKHMIEEAEQQLSSLTEKIQQEERNECEKIINKVKEQYQLEIASLQESLSKMQALEKKYKETKIDENGHVNELKNKLEIVNNENKELKIKLRESQTEISVLRSEIAELKTISSDKNNENYVPNEILLELCSLKQEINALHIANKKLNDTNDILRNELDIMRTRPYRTDSNIGSNNLIRSVPQVMNKSYTASTSRNPLLKYNQRYNSSIMSSSFDHDDELDSGYTASNNEFSDYQYENDNSLFFPHSISNINFKNESELSDNNILSHYSNSDSLTDENAEPIDSRKSKMIKTSNVNYKLPTIIDQKNENRSSLRSISHVSNSAPERVFKVVFAGDSAVGKTSFIMRYCKGMFSSSTSSTLGVDFHMKMIDLNGHKIALQLWDTCGQERFRSIAKSYFRRADGVVLMYDCTYEKSFLNVREWVDIINETSDKRIPIIIIGNKTDLREEARKNKRVIEAEDGIKLAKQYQSLFIETSAKDGSNMDESLIEICKIMSSNQDIELRSDSIRLGLNMNSKKKNCC